MAISKEKVCGWLVYYGSGEIGQYPGGVIELEVIPEVWELYVAKHPKYFDTSDDSEYYGFFAWKRELSFDEKIKRDTGYSLTPFQDLLNTFLVFDVWCLKNWNEFCAEYQRLTPEQIQTAKKFCVLDSVTTPAAPSAPVEYVLYFAVRYGVCDERGELDGEVFLGPLSSPTGFRKALRKRMDLLEALKDSLIRNAPLISISSLEIIESEKYFAQYPEREFNTLNIPKITDFVREFNAGGSQVAPVPVSSLVSSDPVPAVIQAGYVPLTIQGEITEIQDVARDSKRDSTLNAINRQTGVMKEGVGSINETLQEGFEVLGEQMKQLVENTQGFKGINLKPVEEAERKRVVYEEAKNNTGSKEEALAITAVTCGNPNEIKEIWKIETGLDPETDYDDSERRRVKKGIKKGAGKLVEKLKNMAGNPKKDSDC